MSSGKYGALSGAVSRMHMLDNISEHLAAVKTPGYKKGMVTFESRLNEASSGMATNGGNYTRLTEKEIDFTPGPLENSGHPLHLAINGTGFFRIQLQDGSFGYARKGNFQLNGDGQLVNTDGLPVMGKSGREIVLPHSDVDIGSDGTIWADQKRVGQVGLFHFEDTSMLHKIRGEMFQSDNGIEPELHPAPEIVQGSLEGSNVDMMAVMALMVLNLRTFEATERCLKIYNDMDSKSAEIGAVQ